MIAPLKGWANGFKIKITDHTMIKEKGVHVNFIVLISSYFELEMWKLQKESVNAELNSMQRKSYTTR